MAEIPVEKKSGVPWWVWLLGLLLLLGVIWFIYEMTNDNRATTTNANTAYNTNNTNATVSRANANTANTTTAMTGAVTNTTNTAAANTAAANTNAAAANNRVTDPRVYASTQDKSSLVGREAQFTSARVVRVVGPRTFTVATGGEELFVMLDDEFPGGVGSQGRIDPGDTIDLNGRFEPLRAEEVADISNNRFRALTEQERATLRNTQVYLHTNQVRLVS